MHKTKVFYSWISKVQSLIEELNIKNKKIMALSIVSLSITMISS